MSIVIQTSHFASMGARLWCWNGALLESRVWAGNGTSSWPPWWEHGWVPAVPSTLHPGLCATSNPPWAWRGEAWAAWLAGGQMDGVSGQTTHIPVSDERGSCSKLAAPLCQFECWGDIGLFKVFGPIPCTVAAGAAESVRPRGGRIRETPVCFPGR